MDFFDRRGLMISKRDLDRLVQGILGENAYCQYIRSKKRPGFMGWYLCNDSDSLLPIFIASDVKKAFDTLQNRFTHDYHAIPVQLKLLFKQ